VNSKFHPDDVGCRSRLVAVKNRLTRPARQVLEAVLQAYAPL